MSWTSNEEHGRAVVHAGEASRSIVIESRSPWFALLLLPLFAVILVALLLVFGVAVVALLLMSPLLRLAGRRSPRTIDVAAVRAVPRAVSRPGPPDGGSG